MMKWQDNGTPRANQRENVFAITNGAAGIRLSRKHVAPLRAAPRFLVVARKYRATSFVPLTRADANVGCNDTYFTSLE